MFEIKVNKNIISVQETEPITSGSVSVYKCHFVFDPSWDGFFRSAVFRCGSMVNTVPLDDDDMCDMPWELLNKKHIGLPVEVSIYGVKDETEIQPTIWDKLGRVRRGSEPGEDAKEFSPSVYDRIVSLVKLYSDKSKGDKGDKGDPGEGDMTAAVYDPQGRKTDIYQYADNVLASVPEWAMQSAKPTYTASEVGAAPAGYGSEGEAMTYYSSQKQNDSEILAILNGELTKLSNYSSSKFGIYVYPAMDIDLLMCEMIKINANTAMVKAYSYNGWKLQRMFASGVWGAWEWVNPPMVLGIEYRTTERYLNKPVYRKLVSFGTLPNATGKSVAHGCENALYVVSHRITLTNGAEVSGWSGILNVFVDGSNITITTNGDQSAYSANVMIEYTKTTD